MKKYIAIFFIVLLTSFFYFPFIPTFFPIANTKMVLAALGLVILLFKLSNGGSANVDKGIFVLTLFALLVGCVSIFTEFYHATGGYAYATLFISMWVWLGAAYFVAQLIEKAHGEVTMRLFCNYIITVCVLQCLIAITKELYLPAKIFVDSLLADTGFMGRAEGRMYGIGAALDVAGLRFSAVLTMIAYFCINNNKDEYKQHLSFYIFAFLVISIIGSMISRTTLVGIIVALVYWIIMSVFQKNKDCGAKEFWRVFGVFIIIIVPLFIVLYNTNSIFHEQLRFGFEGFFNLAEKGKWETNSNSILKDMLIFPDNLETWIIGDGYIVKPELVDPYYIGPKYYGFYKDSDIGYVLFLFYFGIIGLVAMVSCFVKATHICIQKHPAYTSMFIMMLMVNLIGWCKVTSDIFVAFSAFLVFSTKNVESVHNT